MPADFPTTCRLSGPLVDPPRVSVRARWHGDKRAWRLGRDGCPANRMHALVSDDLAAVMRWAAMIRTDPAIASVQVIDARTGRPLKYANGEA